MKKGLRPNPVFHFFSPNDWETSPDEEGIKTSRGVALRALRYWETSPDEEGIKTHFLASSEFPKNWETSPDEEGIKTRFMRDTEEALSIGRQALMKKGLRRPLPVDLAGLRHWETSPDEEGIKTLVA